MTSTVTLEYVEALAQEKRGPTAKVVRSPIAKTPEEKHRLQLMLPRMQYERDQIQEELAAVKQLCIGEFSLLEACLAYLSSDRSEAELRRFRIVVEKEDRVRTLIRDLDLLNMRISRTRTALSACLWHVETQTDLGEMLGTKTERHERADTLEELASRLKD